MMLAVDQTIFWSEESPVGNCTQAAIASLLDLPLEVVPQFSQDLSYYWDSFYGFIHERGFRCKEVSSDDLLPEKYYLVSGKSERGCYHHVIYKGDKLAHDPHPSRAGIVEAEQFQELVSILEIKK